MSKRERFSAGWSGAVSIALFAYVAVAIALVFVGGSGWPALDTFNLYSDSFASIGVAILAGAAARGSSDPAARRTWWLLTAALCVYTVGNLLNATYWLFGVDPFPSIGDVFFLGFYPLDIRGGADGHPRCRSPRAVGPSRARLDDPAARVRRILLVLRDRAHRRRPARPGRAQVRAGAELHRAQLRHATGLRRPADALGRNPDPAPGADAADARLLVDVPCRHRLGDVEGRRQLHSRRRLGRHLPVVLHLAGGRRARTAARYARRATRPRRIQHRR